MEENYTDLKQEYDKTNIIKAYYENPQTIAKIQQSLTFKETVLKNKEGMIIRCIKTNNGIYLKKNIEHYELLKNRYNIYGTDNRVYLYSCRQFTFRK